jgi:hypothetical protein
VLTVAVTLGGGFAYLAIQEPGWGQRLDCGAGGVVFYADGGTEEDARRLGEALKEGKFFDGSGEKWVRVSRDGPGYVVSVILVRGWDEEEIRLEFLGLGARLSAGTFGGAPVTIHLVDQQLREQAVIHSRGIEFGKGEWVYFPADVPEETGRQLGFALQQAQVFDGGNPKSVYLGRDGNGWAVSVCLPEGMWDNPEQVRFWEDLRGRLARQTFDGQPVVLRLRDVRLTVRKTLSARGP